jgi:hypothetical protein
VKSLVGTARERVAIFSQVGQMVSLLQTSWPVVDKIDVHRSFLVAANYRSSGHAAIFARTN